MFEDVFEPFDDILDEGVEKADEWDTGDMWDTGEKEDVWRSDVVVGGVWSVDPKDQTVQPKPTIPAPAPAPAPAHDQNDTPECEDGGDCGVCENTEKCDKSTGLFDDIFLDIL